MSKQAKATFETKSWNEKPYLEPDDGPKLTRASVTKSYQGDIEGESHVEYLMMYRKDGKVSFVGLERVVGSVGRRSGTLYCNKPAHSRTGWRRSTCGFYQALEPATCTG